MTDIPKYKIDLNGNVPEQIDSILHDIPEGYQLIPKSISSSDSYIEGQDVKFNVKMNTKELTPEYWDKLDQIRRSHCELKLIMPEPQAINESDTCTSNESDDEIKSVLPSYEMIPYMNEIIINKVKQQINDTFKETEGDDE